MSFNDEIKKAKQEVSYIEKNPTKKYTEHEYHIKPNICQDHYIEPLHHPRRDKHSKNRESIVNTRPTIIQQPDRYSEHPRGVIPKFQPLDRKFPKQENLLLDIKTDILKSLAVTFIYNTSEVTKVISEGDIVHAYYVSSKHSGFTLVEVTGKLSYIDYRNMKIYIDYSETYTKRDVGVFVSSLRFISKDIHEVPPFLEKDPETLPPVEEPLEDIDYSYEDDNEGISSNTNGFFIRDDNDIDDTDGLFLQK